MALKRGTAQQRVNKALDALDSIFAIGRGTTAYFKQQTNLMSKAIAQFEEAIGELFSPDDVKPPVSEIELDNPPTEEEEPVTRTGVIPKGRRGRS